MDFGDKFEQALSYQDFLERHASPDQRQQWDDFHRSVQLTADQQALLSSFVRQQRVLCLAGTWCGDCVRQCPIFDHFQQFSPQLDVRYQDRDSDPELQKSLEICGGARVPVVVSLAKTTYQPDATVTEHSLSIARWQLRWRVNRLLEEYRNLQLPSFKNGSMSSSEPS